MNKRYIKNFFYMVVISAVFGLIACEDDTKDLINNPAEEVKTISSINIDNNPKYVPSGDNGSPSVYLLKNEQLQMSCTILPEDVENQKLRWVSSDQSIVSVTSEGLLSGTDKTGEAIIYVSPEVGFGPTEAMPTFKVFVVDSYVYISDFTLPETTIELDETAVYQLEGITVTPDNATFKRFTYESSDPSIVSVDANGLITAVSTKDSYIAEAIITVTTDDLNETPLSKTMKVVVRRAVAIEGISFSQKEKDYLAALGYGEKYQIKPTLEPEGATATLIKWESSDPAVISVNEITGELTVKSTTGGEADITATYNNIIVTVKAKVALGRFGFSFGNGFPTIGNGFPTSWKLSSNGGENPTTDSDGVKTKVFMGKKGSAWRADLVLVDKATDDLKKIIITPATYRYLAVKIRPDDQWVAGTNSKGCIKLGLYDNPKTIGENYLGDTNSDNNSYSMLDGETLSITEPNVIYYDLQGKFKEMSYADSNAAQYALTTMKFIIADFKTENATYDIYWIRSFKTVEELESFVAGENAN